MVESLVIKYVRGASSREQTRQVEGVFLFPNLSEFFEEGQCVAVTTDHGALVGAIYLLIAVIV